MRGGGITRALLPLTLFIASPAAADRALLIGTGAYPNLAPALHLAAPTEDAARLRDALVRAGLPTAAVTVMSDREGTAPTRAAVLDALANLARRAVPGEQVMVYFSGHGAQAPALDPGLEPDGLDELYLMQDAAGWDGGLGRVPGAISDQELASAIEAIRREGADVWFVADTCHAGGLMRGGVLPPDARAKSVSPANLRIPATVRRKPAPIAPVRPEPSGAFAAFYAAAAGSLALERRLPLGAPDARPLSQFSFALVRALDAGRVRSLRDLAVALNAVDATLGGGAPQPMFEGALGMPVLDLPTGRPRRFFGRRVGGHAELAVGSEEGIAPGTRFRLRDAAGREVGLARATAVRLGATELQLAAASSAGALEAEPLDPLRPPAASLIDAAAPIAGNDVARRLAVEAKLWRPGPSRACPSLPSDGSPDTRPLDLLAPPPLGQCDLVIATIANIGDTALDVSPFYLDAARHLIGLAFLRDQSVRVAPGERREVAIRLLSEDRMGRALPVGAERLMLFALPATGTRPTDLRAVADRWRSGEGAEVGPQAGALVYTWTVLR